MMNKITREQRNIKINDRVWVNGSIWQGAGTVIKVSPAYPETHVVVAMDDSEDRTPTFSRTLLIPIAF